MKRGEIQRGRQLLIAALLLFDAYVVEEVGTREEVESASRIIVALLAEIRDRLEK